MEEKLLVLMLILSLERNSSSQGCIEKEVREGACSFKVCERSLMIIELSLELLLLLLIDGHSVGEVTEVDDITMKCALDRNLLLGNGTSYDREV